MRLEIKNLHKSYGQHHVLKGINLAAESGRAFGLLGRNGAGKTTSIRILMDVMKADQGEILIDGRPFLQKDWRIGYLPEEKGLYPKLQILRQMVYIGELRGLSRREAKANAQKWLERLAMEQHAKQKLETLSKGNQQKIQLAVALITNPDIVILDEPFSGLDPVNAQLLKEVVLEQVALGKIVFFSSHQMSYVESFCDDIGILHNGEIVLTGSISDIKHAYPRNRFQSRFCHSDGSLMPPAEALNRLQALAPQLPLRNLSVKDEKVLFEMDGPTLIPEVLPTILKHDLIPDQFAVIEPELEDIFIAYTAGGLENPNPVAEAKAAREAAETTNEEQKEAQDVR